MANPTPSLPPESLWICAVTPITLPSRLSSGPPELPWLIAESVWIESSIANPLGEVIWRWSALTMPLVTVSLESEGAADRYHSVTDGECARVAQRDRLQERCRCAVDPDDREVGGGVRADDRRLVGRRRSRSVTVIDCGAGDDVLVGDDVARVVVDEAGGLRLLRPRAAERRRLVRVETVIETTPL